MTQIDHKAEVLKCFPRAKAIRQHGIGARGKRVREYVFQISATSSKMHDSISEWKWDVNSAWRDAFHRLNRNDE